MFYRVGLSLCLVLSLFSTSFAAPLFPDVSADHWAADAVSRLAAKGLLEGYPDGTFKGDRSASRWELAMIVGRLLAKMETQHSTFASKAELADVRKLADALREELTALGIRVDILEDSTELLDRRVSELERITFSGSLSTRIVNQSFQNKGNDVAGSGPNSLNYNAAVGAFEGANIFPTQRQGVVPVVDLANGRPLTNGTGLSSTAFLNIAIRPDENWNADLKLFAYTSQGDSIVDSIWGVNPPYLANSFTGRTAFGADPQGLNHTPFTQAGFDSLSVEFVPASTTLTLGSFQPKFISPQVYAGIANPNYGDPRNLPGFGFQVAGDMAPFAWEVFGTRLADGYRGRADAPAQSDALGVAFNWADHGFEVGLNFLRAANQPGPGGLNTVGNIGSFNGTPGVLYNDWVNPPGYFVNQLGGIGSPFVAGSGSTSDKRPIPGFADSDALSGRSTLGPQSLTQMGISAGWTGEHVHLFGEYATSEYRSNKNSDFSVDGDLWRLGANSSFFDGRVDVGLEYRYTDARYDPFLMTYPGTAAGTTGIFRAYHRLDLNNYWHQYHLHNTQAFPHNREGLWANLGWQFDPDGRVDVSYRNLRQVTTSLQDVRVPMGALGALGPNVDVLGHSPGFTDVVFREYSPLSFDASLNPLEDERGGMEAFQVTADHNFTGTPWHVEASWERYHFDRGTTLSPQNGGSQNRVDLTNSAFKFAVGYQLNDSMMLTAGYEEAAWRGHYDPGGLYNAYAVNTGDVDFVNRDSVQHSPFVHYTWDVTEGVKFGSLLKLYNTVDKVSPSIFPGEVGGRTDSAHPFGFTGYQLGTSLDITF